MHDLFSIKKWEIILVMDISVQDSRLKIRQFL